MGNESAAFDREAFERWRDTHPANARAFEDAAKVWGLDLPVSATRYAQNPNAAPGRAGPSERSLPPSRATLLAIAATVVAVIAGFGVHYGGLLTGEDVTAPTQMASILSTAPHESRSFRLADGSIATLGPSSKIRVAYSDQVRRLALDRGQARFIVAHDSERPFEVLAGGQVITARGTVFDVRFMSSGLRVALLKGAIDIERFDGSRRTGALRHLAPGDTVTLPLDRRPAADANASPAKPPVGAMLTFDRVTLLNAISAFNAANSRKIVVEGSAALETISGAFSVNDPEGFAQMLASMFDLKLTRRANGDLALTSRH